MVTPELVSWRHGPGAVRFVDNPPDKPFRFPPVAFWPARHRRSRTIHYRWGYGALSGLQRHARPARICGVSVTRPVRWT